MEFIYESSWRNGLVSMLIYCNIILSQVGDGNADHQCWERPEDMDTPRTLYKITPNSPGTEAAAEAAAALAAASLVFKAVDSRYSAKLLRHSQSVRPKTLYTYDNSLNDLTN